MFERFTERARKVFALANQEAQRFNHEYIGTEHILLGLVKEGSGVGANVLKNVGADLHKLRTEVEKLIKPGPDMVTMGKLPQTPRAKKVVEYAIEEARNLSHNYVGTEHLLLGLLREHEGVAAQVLMNLGLKLDEVREEVLNLLGAGVDKQGAGKDDEERPSVRRRATGRTLALDTFSRDLTELARKGQLDPATGRDREIARVVTVLCRRRRRNPLLVGPPGVGRTSVVEGLAQRIAAGKAPEPLLDRRIVAVDLVLLVAGTQYRGQLEQRVTELLAEVRREKRVILFLDDLHVLLQESQEAAAAAFKGLLPAIARGEGQCIGATTPEAHAQQLAADGTFDRLFRPVFVRPPDAETTVRILHALRDRFEAFHRLRYADEALEAAVELSCLFLPATPLPDKAIDLIDEAGAAERLQAAGKLPEVAELEARIRQVSLDKDEAVKQADYERAPLRDQTERLREERQQRLDEHRSRPAASAVDVEAIVQALADLTGIDAEQIRRRDTSSVAGE